MVETEAGSVLELSEGNLADYLRSHTALLNPDLPVEVRELGGGPDSPEADGFVNFIFRARQGDRSWIVKQARPYLRMVDLGRHLEPERNFHEYLAFQLRAGIDSGSVPRVHHVDQANNVFVMEDLRDTSLRSLRFQLSEGLVFPRFTRQMTTFLADNHFFTSELFLDKQLFRQLQAEFSNLSMRAVMEDVVLTRLHVAPAESPLSELGASAWDDPILRLELIKIRDVLIHKAECLIHGDLHTSNVFTDANTMRIIDMEYVFVGPFSYDLGYLLANFVSQYAAFEFNERFPPLERHRFQGYLLRTIREVLDGYFARFTEQFRAYAKPLYRDTPGYLEDHLFPAVLSEAIGFMAAANLHRLTSLAPFPDFDVIPDEAQRLQAQGLSASIDEHLLRHRQQLSSPALLSAAISSARDRYRSVVAPADA